MSIFLEVMLADTILRQWKDCPNQSRSSYNSVSWPESRPLSDKEVEALKALLRKHAPSSFEKLFPEEATGGARSAPPTS